MVLRSIPRHRRLPLVLLGSALLGTACGGADAGGAADADGPAATATTVAADDLCGAYIGFLSTASQEELVAFEGRLAELMAPIDPAAADVFARDLEFDAATAPERSEREAARAAVVEACRDRFAAGVTGAGDNATAAQQAFDNTVSGHLDANATIAWENARTMLVIGDRVSPNPEEGTPSFEVEGDTVTFRFIPLNPLVCSFEGDDGIISDCVFGSGD